MSYDVEIDQWFARANRDLRPKIEASALCLSILPRDGKPDAKIAVEVGFALLLGKPLILIVDDIAKVPEKLRALADEIVTIDRLNLDYEQGQRVGEAIERVIAKRATQKPDPVKVSGERVAKRMLWLAYQNTIPPMNMGILQARANATEDEVWEQALTRRDYPAQKDTRAEQRLDADYVFGRMVKLYLKWSDDTIEIVGPKEPVQGYNPWCVVFPTFAALELEARKSLAMN